MGAFQKLRAEGYKGGQVRSSDEVGGGGGGIIYITGIINQNTPAPPFPLLHNQSLLRATSWYLVIIL